LHPATERNVRLLRSYGAHIIEPETGELASGFHGTGRLPEPQTLVNAVLKGIRTQKTLHTHGVEWSIAHDLAPNLVQDLLGIRALLTAGPTHEAIDDVRFIGNRSSGKMGFALASELARRGAAVTLVSGPVALPTPSISSTASQTQAIERVTVESAAEMYDAVMERRAEADVIICAAAVADFTPRVRYSGKLKKSSLEKSSLAASSVEDESKNKSKNKNKEEVFLRLELVQTKDILAAVGAKKSSEQLVVGFALESANYEEYGRKKLHEKNCDIVVLNAANKPQSGFGGDDNTITLLFRDGRERSFPPASKQQCAVEIIDAVANALAALKSR
jgi:phosphopantothenoylcysteine decarboxylase / phosphopantothenate---cysteine ligase